MQADLREPHAILDHPTTQELIGFDQPIALMLVAVVHFLRDDEHPRGIIPALTDRLPEGSCLLLSDIIADFDGGAALEEVSEVYENSTAQLIVRGTTSSCPSPRASSCSNPAW